MEVQLPLLFESYNRCVERLNDELAEIADRVPPERRGAFRIAEYDFETFRMHWERISCNESLLHGWLQRLSPTGFDKELAQIRADIGNVTFSASEKVKAAA